MKKTILLLLCTFLLCTAFSFAADDDGDGIDSAIEIANGTDPDDGDTDNDMLPDGQEDMDQNGIVEAYETNPLDSDTDDDGLSDGEEFFVFMLNNLNPDSDGDGLTDGQELGRTFMVPGGFSYGAGIPYEGTALTWVWDFDPSVTTDPRDHDTDRDGIPDGIEDGDHHGAAAGTGR
jgi:hypothetical protein